MNQDDRISIARLDERVQTLFNRMDEHQQRMDVRFDKLEAKLDAQEKETDKVKAVGARASAFLSAVFLVLGAGVAYIFDWLPHR